MAADPKYPKGDAEPYHLYGIAHFVGEDLEFRTTVEKVASLCTVVTESEVEVFVEEVLEVVSSAKIDGYNSEKGFFFPTCRRLKCHVATGQRPGMGRHLTALALLQLDLLDKAGKLPTDDMWSDSQAVALAFENTWDQVKFAENESLTAKILERAKLEGPLQGEGLFGLFVRYAWHLQKHQKDKPIFLPVSQQLADLFGVSQPQIGTYVNTCHNRGYLVSKGKCLPNKRARTWFFNFDHPDFKPRLTVS